MGVRQRRVPEGNNTAQWNSPPPGSLKLNSDATVFSDGSAGLGFVVRNHWGKVILAGAKRCNAAVKNSTLIEALALRFGVSSADREGLDNLILESDSRNLILALKGEMVFDADSMMIIEDIGVLARKVGCSDFCFVRKDANRVAHTISHFGHFIDFEQIWTMNVPDCCRCIVENDVRREPLNHE